MSKAGHYTDLLRQVNELKRQLHLVEAERKACEDEGNEIVKRNQQRLNKLKQHVNDIKMELGDAVRMSSRSGHQTVMTQQTGAPQSAAIGQLGVLQVLKDHQIDASKYKLTKTAEEILKDLDGRIADMVKQADLAKHQTQMIYQRMVEIDEELRSSASEQQPPISNAAVLSISSAGTKPIPQLKQIESHLHQEQQEATLTEIQSVRQRMAEALHIQRQYRTILDVLASERIGYEAQLIELEKGIAEAKIEATKLKEVREAARRAKDAARTELQHYEETLVASTRETDRLLSDYKRRIDEMKSSANPSHRQHHPQQQQRPSNAGQQPHNQPGRPSLVSGELLAANMSNDASNADPAALLERSTLLETKRAIDRLKSVTGATDIRSTIHIVESQKEKCDELRQQFSVLQERQGYLTLLKDSLQTRLKTLMEAPSVTAVAASGQIQQPRLLDQLFQDEDELGGGGPTVVMATDEEQLVVDSYETALVPVVALITKICTQIPFGPSVEEMQEKAAEESGEQIRYYQNILSLLESKVAALIEMTKSVTSSRAGGPITVEPLPEMLFSQVGQLSLPPSPRLLEPGMLGQPTAGDVTTGSGDAGGPAVGGPSTTRSVTAATTGAHTSSSTVGKLRNESFSDEDQVPTRGFLKRQTRIIVEAKTKKQNQRPRKGGGGD